MSHLPALLYTARAAYGTAEAASRYRRCTRTVTTLESGRLVRYLAKRQSR